MSIYKNLCSRSHKKRYIVDIVEGIGGVDITLDCGCVVKGCWIKSVECRSDKILDNGESVFVQVSLKDAEVSL